MGSLLLLTWPILSFSELPQKSASLENYSVENGFNRTLPLTSAAYQSTIKTPRTTIKTEASKEAIKTTSKTEKSMFSRSIKKPISTTAKTKPQKLQKKTESLENYSAQNGFDRTSQQLPLTYNSTAKAMPSNERPSENLENYSTQNGFDRTLPAMKVIHKSKSKAHNSTESTKTVKKHKSSHSKVKRKSILITKRQPYKNQANRKERIAIAKPTVSKPTIVQQIASAVERKSFYQKTPMVKIKANSPLQQAQVIKKIDEPKQYSKRCAQLYKQNDFTQAITACEKAAQHNDSQAALWLAKIYSIGTANNSPDYEKAHFYATMSANQDNAEAQFLLALCYENGIGVAQNKNTALHWYQQAAQNGLTGTKVIENGTKLINKPAIHMAWAGATEYKQAINELKKPNTREAGLETLSKAAQMGHPAAQYQLALKYLQGDSITQDDAQALNLLTQSADRGHAPAQTYVAWMNLLGLGTTQNTEQAVQQFLEAKQLLTIDESDASVQAKLAALTSIALPSNNQPLTKNQRLAEMQRGIDLLEMSEDGSAEGLAILTKAAESNNIEAQLYLARLYQQGEKVSKQDELAAKWYQRAASSGNSEAQYALGWISFYGQGLPKNTHQALAYFMKASLSGNDHAKQATAFIQAQVADQPVNKATTENPLRPTIASKVKEKVADNVNGIFKAMGFNGFSKKS